MSDRIKTVGTFPFEGELAKADPAIDSLIRMEEERQTRRLILIPSESLCHPLVRQTMQSVYGNLYAEGYPSSLVSHMNEEQLSDFRGQLSIYRRYADRRFYKGTDYANMVESLCIRRAAEVFANERVDADHIFANVQALSGAAANLAVFEAFLNDGDTILSMDLMHGGHLSHGSEFHMSGRRFKIVPYGISPVTEKLDYDRIEELAMEHRPNLIIAGYTSYPWAPDWERFRAIADRCGALLMADIAHPAGMASAGAYPSPVGLADVTTFTTHKTLMGPRGSIILTTDLDKARMVDLAVFPGEQGGPHVNTITALAVALELAKTESFKAVQKQIVENAAHFANALTEAGLKLAYGGTDTHLLLTDLKGLPKVTDEQLRGEMAVRMLELCGIVANKNTIPGDDLTAMATGVRMGTPWLTQRGITKEQLTRLANVISKILHDIHPFKYDGLTGTLPRGKMHFDVLEEAKREVAELVDELEGRDTRTSGYPHYQILAEEHQDEGADDDIVNSEAVFIPVPTGIIRVTGERVEAHLQNQVTNDLSVLKPGEALRTLMLTGEGDVLDDVVVMRIRERDDKSDNGFYVMPSAGRAQRVLSWTRGHADGYLLFEPADITAKVEGPAVVEDLTSEDCDEADRVFVYDLYGKRAPSLAQDETWRDGVILAQVKGENLVRLVVPMEDHEEVTRKLLRSWTQHPVGGHKLLRETDKRPEPGTPVKELIEKGQTKWFDIHKPYFIGQNLVKDAFDKPENLPEFSWQEEEGELKRTTLYETHKKLTKKLVPFAGWEMPVWYTSTLEEHRAVRSTCGLFDVSHMGVFDITGPNAVDFLDLVSTNYSKWVRDGESYYSYLPLPNGHLLDDIMVYRLNAEHFLVVVNAGNEDKDWAWMNAVNEGKVLIDYEIPQRRILKPAVLRNLKDRAHGEDCRVNLALQGPRSRDVLLALIEPEQRDRLLAVKRTGCGEFTLGGLPVVISRTGYTGEQMGFEVFVHPDRAPEMWDKLMQAGQPFGLLPCGLASRDSTRTEAGLPLYGHELEGTFDLTPHGAGFPSYVKFHKPFFIGKQAMLKAEAERTRETVRFCVPEKGTKPLKPGDPVANSRGDFIGNVTSCATDMNGLQIGLAYVLRKYTKPGKIAVFPMLPENRRKGLVMPLELEEKLKTVLPVQAEIIDRFPQKPIAKDLVREEALYAAEPKA